MASRLARRLLLKALDRVRTGEIVLVDGEERQTFGRPTEEFPVTATLEVIDPRFYARALFGGSIGAGEAWADGYWTTDDLTALVRIMARNSEALDAMEGALATVSLAVDSLTHRLNENTRRGSRRNIAAHYDLGNDFFALFLDPAMMYSSAVFPTWTTRLDQAATYKLDLICHKLDLQPEDEVVEIGSGWGGFAIHAARNYGCRVVTTTISRRQFDFARRRIAEEGLDDRVEVLLEDYRDLPRVTRRRFRKLVSIEMIEAVGHRHLPAFFATVDRLLEPAGRALIQAITIRDQRYDAYRASVDFIQRHIFPGGLLPSLERLADCISRETDMVVSHLEDIGGHYASTLAAWRRRFDARRSEISELGLDERFQRLWEFYFCYCEGGFRERSISAIQMVCSKPLDRGRPLTIVI
jgi:cyclopropane-fatty-acyl-phospholipid synthase